MNYDQILNQKIQGVKPSGIRKFFDILEEMTDAITLGIGEPDFVTPWHIRGRGYILPGAGPHQVYLQRRHAGAAAGDCQLPAPPLRFEL